MQLSRLQAACELLRKVIRFLYLARKLKSHLQGGSRELPKAAQCVLELEVIRKESDLSGITVIDIETRWILKASEDVLTGAARMLLQGMETQNQAEVAAALQVFYNLGNLKQKVEHVITSISDKASLAIRTVVAIPINEDSQNKDSMRALLWNRIEKLLDTLHVYCIQIWHLHRVLAKIRDPTTHHSLLDELRSSNDPSIIQAFWKDLCTKLTDQLERSTKTSPTLDSLLIGEFPKLYRLLLEFLRRLQTHYEIKHVQGTLTSEEQNLLINNMNFFKNSYLNRGFSKLYDNINKLFIGNLPPSSEDVSTITTLLTNELDLTKSTLMNDDLAIPIAKNTAKGIKLFNAKIESLIATDPTASQISDSLNPSQLKNIKLFTNLYQIQSSIQSVLIHVSNNVKIQLNEALNDTEKLQNQILSPIFTRVTKHLEQVIVGIHKEDFTKEMPTDSTSTSQNSTGSLYIRSLLQQIQFLQSNFISKFPLCTSLTNQLREMASRLVLYFVRHAALVRPLEEPGKLKLAGDLAQLEFAVSLLHPVKDLGNPYKILRQFRPFLFKETNTISNCEELKILPPSVVLHHLFSRGTPSLQLPHAIRGWTVAKYSEWMDSHTEEEIWQLIKSSLDLYAKQVNQRGEKEFTPIYPVLLQLGPSLFNKKS